MSLHQEEVVRPVADRVMQAVPSRAHPELDGVRIWHRRHLLGFHDSAECARAGIVGVVVAQQQPPNRRLRAVGTDHQVSGGGAAIGELEDGLRAGVVDVHEPLAEVDAVHPDGSRQDDLQVSAVDADIGMAIFPLVVEPMLGDQAPVPTVAIDQGLNLVRLGPQLFLQAETVLIEAGGVGGERDGCADFPQLIGLLIELDIPALVLERDCEGQAADARTDDRQAL